MGILDTRRGWIAAITSVISAGVTVKAAPAEQSQTGLQEVIPNTRPEELRLPNGKKQSEEILKAEHLKNLSDAKELSGMTRSLQEELEREDRFVLSISTLKKLDDIEKLTKRIRARLKH